MKALLVILAICIIDTLSQGVKVSEKVYPKKYASGKILLNPSKYETAYKYAKYNISHKQPLPTVARSYTAFPFIENHSQMILSGIPDSPYFPIDPGYHQKSSVKKTIPDLPFSLFLRRKRSADVSIVPPAEKDEKKIEPKAAEEQKETTQAPTAAAASIKAETTVALSSLPKEVKEESKSTANIITTTGRRAERSGAAKAKKKVIAPARKGQPKSKAAGKKNRKPKGKSAVVRAKPKGKKGKKNLQRLRPSNTKINKKKNKGNLQRSKIQKAKKPKNARAGKAPKGKKQGQPTKIAKKPK